MNGNKKAPAAGTGVSFSPVEKAQPKVITLARIGQALSARIGRNLSARLQSSKPDVVRALSREISLDRWRYERVTHAMLHPETVDGPCPKCGGSRFVSVPGPTGSWLAECGCVTFEEMAAWVAGDPLMKGVA